DAVPDVLTTRKANTDCHLRRVQDDGDNDTVAVSALPLTRTSHLVHVHRPAVVSEDAVGRVDGVVALDVRERAPALAPLLHAVTAQRLLQRRLLLLREHQSALSMTSCLV